MHVRHKTPETGAHTVSQTIPLSTYFFVQQASIKHLLSARLF